MKKIFVLSMASDFERRAKIETSLNLVGLNFIFVDAIDGRINHIKRSPNSKLTNTEAACSLGHLNIYKSLVSSSDEYAIILEDDVSIIENNIHLLKDLIEKIDCTLPAVYVLGGQEGIRSAKYFVGKKVASLGHINILQSYKSSDYIFRTCCYLITKTAAKNIISLNQDLIFAADSWYEFKNRQLILEPYLVQPGLFAHPTDLTSSHIEASRRQNNKYKGFFKKYFSIFLRLIKYVVRVIQCRFS